MPDDLSDPSTELANLEAENGARMVELIKGGAIRPEGLGPQAFENLKVTTFLEAILDACGPATLQTAKMTFANRMSAFLDNIEEQVAKARIAHPTGNGAVDLSRISSITDARNRQERRHPTRPDA